MLNYIVVLNDGETYTNLDGCRIYVDTDEEPTTKFPPRDLRHPWYAIVLNDDGEPTLVKHGPI